MSNHDNSSSTHEELRSPQEEGRYVNIRGVVITTLALVGILLFSAVFLYFLFNYYEGDVAKADIPPSPVEDSTSQPPSPRLQANPTVDLVEFRRREDSLLQSSGWVDSALGVAHIPVDSAMEVIVRTGKIPMKVSSTLKGDTVTRDTLTRDTSQVHQ
jgi:hypothetical protein